LAVGDTLGIIRYYKNVGTKDRPLFSTPIQVGDQKVRLLVDAADWDHDGSVDIIAGSVDGTVKVYRNTGSRGKARFDMGFAPASPPIEQPRVVMVDMNGDGDDDLFIPGTQGSIWVERSFLEHGYARARLVKVEKR
jgi:hypothetical protein